MVNYVTVFVRNVTPGFNVETNRNERSLHRQLPVRVCENVEVSVRPSMPAKRNGIERNLEHETL
jgi:hypothetical protein